MTKFTKIERHPLNNNFMLFCPVAPALYPFFGTLKECKEKQIVWEQKLNEEFSKLPKDRQNEIRKNMELAGL